MTCAGRLVVRMPVQVRGVACGGGARVTVPACQISRGEEMVSCIKIARVWYARPNHAAQPSVCRVLCGRSRYAFEVAARGVSVEHSNVAARTSGGKRGAIDKINAQETRYHEFTHLSRTRVEDENRKRCTPIIDGSPKPDIDGEMLGVIIWRGGVVDRYVLRTVPVTATWRRDKCPGEWWRLYSRRNAA